MDRVEDRGPGSASQPGRHIDQSIEPKGPSDDESREAELSRSDGWGALGLVLFLTPDELEKQGVDPETTDTVIVRIQDGFLLIDSE